MSFNGSGTFVINTAGQPVVANTVISATVFNALTSDLATGLSTCITKDGQTTVTANIPFGNNKITSLGAGTAATDASNMSQVQSTAAKLITVTGTDTITGTMSPALASYAAGQLFYFIANAANTGAMTINIDGLGAKSITRDGSTALIAGDVNTGEIVVICYDGTRFQMINAANSFGNTTINGTLTVTGNTGLQANVSITSALSVGGVFAVTGAATLGSTLAVTGKSDLPTVSTASMNAAVAVVTTGTVTNLTSTSASIASMNAGVALLTNATVTTLTATGASIASANIGNLQFTAASIASINAGVAVINNLTATSASIASANVGTAVITTGTLTNLTATSASVASANAAVALITTGTVTNLTATSASVASANVGTAVITGLTVTGASIASVNAATATLSGNLTLNGGTANGVLYLNGSKVATSGSTLTFDGTNLGVPQEISRSATTQILRIAGGTPADGAQVLLSGSTHPTVPGRLLLQSSGTGSIEFSTGGSVKALLDSSGNLGIGTTSPNISGYGANSRILTIQGVSGSYAINELASNSANSDGTYVGRLDFSSRGQAAGYENIASIASFLSGSTSTKFGSVLQFFTRADNAGSGSPVERMRLDASGNLGLGVTPSAWGSNRVALQVGASGKFSEFIGSGNGVGFGHNYFFDGTNYKYINTDVASRFSFDYDATGGYAWLIAPSGTAGNTITFTQAMTLDASGNLLLNTTNAVSKLVIFEGAAAGATVPAVITLGPRSTTVASGEVLGRVQFYSNDASPSSAGVVGKIDCIATSTFVGDCETALTFHTNDGAAGTIAERVRITAAGEILVGTSSASASANAGAKIFPGGTMRCVNADSTNSTENWSMYSTGAADYRFYVGWGGTVYATNTTISSLSDQRLKENIRDLDVGLDAILALKPRKFDWKEGKGQDKKDVRGFVAQEIGQVFPDLIDEWKDPAPEGEEPYKSVRQDLIPVLVKAIQELAARVAALEGK